MREAECVGCHHSSHGIDIFFFNGATGGDIEHAEFCLDKERTDLIFILLYSFSPIFFHFPTFRHKLARNLGNRRNKKLGCPPQGRCTRFQCIFRCYNATKSSVCCIILFFFSPRNNNLHIACVIRQSSEL